MRYKGGDDIGEGDRWEDMAERSGTWVGKSLDGEKMGSICWRDPVASIEKGWSAVVGEVSEGGMVEDSRFETPSVENDMGPDEVLEPEGLEFEEEIDREGEDAEKIVRKFEGLRPVSPHRDC